MDSQVPEQSDKPQQSEPEVTPQQSEPEVGTSTVYRPGKRAADRDEIEAAVKEAGELFDRNMRRYVIELAKKSGIHKVHCAVRVAKRAKAHSWKYVEGVVAKWMEGVMPSDMIYEDLTMEAFKKWLEAKYAWLDAQEARKS